MIAVIAALFAVLPGYALSGARFARRSRSAGAVLSEAIVWSVLFDSVPAWAPFGTRIPLTLWIWVVAAAACIGGIMAGVNAARALSQRNARDTTSTLFFWLAFIPLCCFGFVLVVRPIIDWDAVTYYLPVAIDTVLSGHTSIYLSSHITTAYHAPNVQPPIMPMLYALAIGLAAMTHAYAADAVRLVPLVFIAGIWLCTRRIARLFVPPQLADAAGLLYLLLPETIGAVCENPLYLDLGFTFLCVALLAEILEFDTGDRSAWLRIGAIASAAVLMKVNGSPFIVLVICATVVAHLPKVWARCAAAFIAAAMIGVSAKLHFFDGVAGIDLWLSIAAVTALLVYCARRCAHVLGVTYVSGLLGLAALLPAVLQLVRLTRIIGSPAAYYVPQLARVPTPHWHDAVRLIDRAAVYASSRAPGLPQHFGLGLLLWWGFSPLLAIVALVGIIAAARRSAPLLQVALVVLLFALAFLTVFRLDDFRHLMPVTPLLAVLAVYAISLYSRTEHHRAWVAVLLAAAIPFTWTAQQRFFSPPIGFLEWAKIDQWQSMSSGALLNIVIFCAVIAIAGWFAVRRLSATWTEALLAAVMGAMFMPVMATAASPGLTAHANQVVNDEAGGYPAIALPALNEWHARLLLTYKSYGITWFSLGHARRLELLDATDLARIQGDLHFQNARTILERLGIDGSILPADPGPEAPAFERLIRAGNLYGIETLNDPLLSASTSNGYWTYRRFYPSTQPQSLRAALYSIGPGDAARISDGAVPGDGTWNAFRIDPPKRTRFVRAVVELMQYAYSLPANFSVSVPVRNDTVSIDSIARAAKTKPYSFYIQAVIFTSADGKVVASFRSTGVTVTPVKYGYVFRNASPFILHAADALTPSTVPFARRGATFPVRWGASCPRGSTILLTAGATRVPAHAGSEVHVRFSHLPPQQLILQGQGSCRIGETLQLIGGAFSLRSVSLRS